MLALDGDKFKEVVGQSYENYDLAPDLWYSALRGRKLRFTYTMPNKEVVDLGEVSSERGIADILKSAGFLKNVPAGRAPDLLGARFLPSRIGAPLQ